MSKGSRPRPHSVTQTEYDTRWDAIFGRDLKEDRLAREEAELEDEEFERIQQANKSTTK